jgi:hypothetical protein
MMDQPLPAELQEFLAAHIDSIAQLEALLLLRGAPDVVWDVEGTARRLYIDEQQASQVLAQLCAEGLVEAEAGSFRFRPRSDALLRMAALLDEHYRRYLIPITNLIHAKPRRIRQFADAFKLKKD